MSWIKTILPKDADTNLKKIYESLFRKNENIKNIYSVNSLRPHTIEALLSFEKSIIKSNDNKLPGWFIEAIGMYVSYLNGCEYCIEHHHDNIKALLKNNVRAEEIRSALAENQPGKVFDVWEKAIMQYAETLTKNPASVTEESIEELRICGLEDQEILEVTQAVSFFSCTNRIALGLGVKVEEHLLGLSSKQQ
jgi:uncharacterized peroxidase-related enzyme